MNCPEGKRFYHRSRRHHYLHTNGLYNSLYLKGNNESRLKSAFNSWAKFVLQGWPQNSLSRSRDMATGSEFWMSCTTFIVCEEVDLSFGAPSWRDNEVEKKNNERNINFISIDVENHREWRLYYNDRSEGVMTISHDAKYWFKTPYCQLVFQILLGI